MNLLTPPGIAGIAVVAADAAERLRLCACLRTSTGAPWPDTGGALPRRARLVLDGTAIDDVLVVDRGALGCELHLHGSPAVLEALRAVFPVAAVAPVDAAEALAWRALAPSQLQLAHEQRELAAAGAGFAALLHELARLPFALRAPRGAAALARSRVALALAEPTRLVLVGAQNAGKSTLFNRLLARDRVLTGPLPGLTRDPVAEPVVLDGYPYELIDTAGEGDTATAVDAAALAAGRARRVGALALLVIDRSVAVDPASRALATTATLVVGNKADRPAAPWPADLCCDLIVAADRAAPGVLAQSIGESLRARRGLPRAGPVGGAAALTTAEFRRLVALLDAPA